MSLKKISLFVIGDSISIHYGPYLPAYLGDQFAYDRKGGIYRPETDISEPVINGGDSSLVLQYLCELLEKKFQTDWLLLNCGLHDIKRHGQTKNLQVPPEQYRENLVDILALARDRAQKIVWVRTTPVDDNIHFARTKEFLRFNKDVLEYNAIADEIFGGAQCPVIDLYGFTGSLDENLYVDHIHYNVPVRKLQAAFIAGHLRALAGGPQVKESNHLF